MLLQHVPEHKLVHHVRLGVGLPVEQEGARQLGVAEEHDADVGHACSHENRPLATVLVVQTYLISSISVTLNTMQVEMHLELARCKQGFMLSLGTLLPRTVRRCVTVDTLVCPINGEPKTDTVLAMLTKSVQGWKYPGRYDQAEKDNQYSAASTGVLKFIEADSLDCWDALTVMVGERVVGVGRALIGDRDVDGCVDGRKGITHEHHVRVQEQDVIACINSDHFASLPSQSSNEEYEPQEQI